MGDARADIPRERFYYPGTFDPIRPNAPFVPATGNDGAPVSLPIVGLLIIGGVILLLEHLRKGR